MHEGGPKWLRLAASSSSDVLKTRLLFLWGPLSFALSNHRAQMLAHSSRIYFQNTFISDAGVINR